MPKDQKDNSQSFLNTLQGIQIEGLASDLEIPSGKKPKESPVTKAKSVQKKTHNKKGQNGGKSGAKKNKKLDRKFNSIADRLSNIVGSPYWFIFSLLLVLIWLPSGFFLGFNEIWHLLINTTTTILTFLMMSLLHASQKKWEQKMENIQRREGSEIKSIKEEAEKITRKM